MTRQIPIISWAQAGTNGFFEDCYPVGVGFGSLNWFNDLKDENAYALQIRGDSMEDRYCNGDFIVVSPAAGATKGDYAVIKLKDGQILAKKIKSSNGVFVLASSNKDYEDITVNKEDVVFIHKIVGTRQLG